VNQRREVIEMRVARPARDLAVSLRFYVEDVGLEHLGGFEEHDGYEGVFIGFAGAGWHLELTRDESTVPQPTVEDLLVLYLTAVDFAAAKRRMAERGHVAVTHPNQYWAHVGALVYLDPDGYPLVLSGPRVTT
jgi:catechol 2,3-dioxygenase-like lactoylglutathione lyase family enzyme